MFDFGVLGLLVLIHDANRELWESTVFIVNYDENDGLFDHVVPPTPPAGTADEFVTRASAVGTPGNGPPSGSASGCRAS